MGTTRLRRPAAPTDAERARSVAARSADSPRVAAALVGTGSPIAHPRAHHVYADGSAVLLLADDEPVLERLRGDGPQPAMLELADHAPVALREPVRALLWVTGSLVALAEERARRIVVGLVEDRPQPAFLELGHGASLVRLTPGSAVLSDAEGSAALSPVDLAAAQPDPFCRYERPWLAHLEQAHPEVFPALARHLPAPLRDARDLRIRPLGVDRCGLRLRVEVGDRDNDVRLGWSHPISTTEELRAQFQRLVGCPYRAAGAA